VNERPTIVYLVRHGETEWNAEGRCQGRNDAPLTKEGEAQIRALAAELADVPFDAAYTSPLPRAIRTAETILEGRRLRARRVNDLAEFCYGALQGTRFVDWPDDLHDRWRRDPWSVAFPDGESLPVAESRVLAAFRQIVDAHPGDTVLVSAHGTVNRLIVAAHQQRSRDEFWSIDQVNGAATLLAVSRSSANA
jgi:broad specificity phosphatase PhoE